MAGFERWMEQAARFLAELGTQAVLLLSGGFTGAMVNAVYNSLLQALLFGVMAAQAGEEAAVMGVFQVVGQLAVEPLHERVHLRRVQEPPDGAGDQREGQCQGQGRVEAEQDERLLKALALALARVHG